MSPACGVSGPAIKPTRALCRYAFGVKRISTLRRGIHSDRCIGFDGLGFFFIDIIILLFGDAESRAL